MPPGGQLHAATPSLPPERPSMNGNHFTWPEGRPSPAKRGGRGCERPHITGVVSVPSRLLSDRHAAVALIGPRRIQPSPSHKPPIVAWVSARGSFFQEFGKKPTDRRLEGRTPHAHGNKENGSVEPIVLPPVTFLSALASESPRRKKVDLQQTVRAIDNAWL